MTVLTLGLLSACAEPDETEVRGTSFEQPGPVNIPGLTPEDADGASDPGDLVAAHPLGGDAVPEGANGWEVVYRSTDAHGESVNVSGVVYAPDERAPSGGRPVYSWAHGPTGLSDKCAPTRSGVSIPYVDNLIQAGFVVVATDYEGLGTPGPHPFLVGSSAGSSVLDIVRAAQRLDVAGAGSRVITAGHFQGGHAALFAAMRAQEYAPDLQLLGVVAGVPTAEVGLAVGALAGVSSLFGYFVMAASGYASTYDDLAMEDLLSPAAMERMAVLDEGCAAEIVAEFADTPVEELVVRAPFESKKWVERLAENDVVPMAIGVPLLILHGVDDDVIPPQISDRLVDGLCEAGSIVRYARVRGVGHLDVYDAEEATVFAWLDARLNAEPATSTC